MSALDFFDDDRREPSPEFQNAMDYSDTYLRGLNENRGLVPQTKTQDITSMADAEQAITDTIAYIAAEGSKTMDSAQMAVLVKGLSDIRTILTSGDVARDNASEPEEQEEPHEEKEQSKPSGVSGGNVPASKPTPPPEAKNTPEDQAEESNLKKLLKMVESNISWSQTQRDMDPGQVAYMAKLKGLIKGFKSLQELVVFLISYGTEGHGRLTNNMFVFLIILYLSDVPERYTNIFLLNPMEYYESPLTKTRAYDYDVMISMMEKGTA